MNCFDLLGLSDTASEADVKESYRAKSLLCHPDVGGDPIEFQRLHEAYKEALKLVNEQICPHCQGTKKVQIQNKFTSITMLCPHCALD